MTMSQMLLAAFSLRDDTDATISELERAGYDPHSISIITKDTKTVEGESTESPVAEGALSGAGSGAIIGGIAGLLAGAGVLPGLAGLLIGGPIAAALGATGAVATTITGAITGAAAGGLIGALVNLGVSPESAKYYDDTVNQGGYVLVVPAKDGDTSQAR